LLPPRKLLPAQGADPHRCTRGPFAAISRITSRRPPR
jgi:hypothetical protein